jgi:FAD/FMN-containing dehydrogenase
MLKKYDIGIDHDYWAVGPNAIGSSVTIHADEGNPEMIEYGRKIWDELIKFKLGLHCVPYWGGYQWWKHLIPLIPAQYINVLAALKNALDPNNILQPTAFMLNEIER